MKNKVLYVIMRNINIYLKVLFFLFSVVNISSLTAKNYSVNKKGIAYYSIENKKYSSFLASNGIDNICLSPQKVLWRVSQVDTCYFYLDNLSEEKTKTSRLRATRYLPMTLTTHGLEGRNDDVQWEFVPKDNQEWGYIVHKSTGRYLCSDGKKVSVAELQSNDNAFIWRLSLDKINLQELESPIIMMGDDTAGFRDPAVIYKDGIFYLYYSYVLTEESEKIYWYVAMSKSRDLVHWSDPKILTEKGQDKNFASPGNVIRFNDEYILCMQTYVMPGYTRKDPIRYGNEDCRVWITKSKDLENWSEPELLEVYGPGVKLESMIDAYLLEDKNEKGKWWCFYKPKGGGAGYSWSYDLKTWHPYGRTQCGENVCVWVENNKYLMMHSPHDGMGILQSSDLKNWSVYTEPDNLGKKDWPWASRRVTAGYLTDLRNDPRINHYLMFFHGQGPDPQSTEIINSGTDLGIAWSKDLKTWDWPGK